MKFICRSSPLLEVKVEECLEKCLLEKRCLPYPFLKKIAGDYVVKNDNEFSVTELLLPLRQVFLRRKREITINPRSLYYRLAGTAIHQFLMIKEKLYRCEVSLEHKIDGNFLLKGIIDVIDKREKKIIDYKTISYEFLNLLKKNPELFESHSQLLNYKKQLEYYYYLYVKNKKRPKIKYLEIHLFPRDVPSFKEDVYYVYTFEPPKELEKIEEEIFSRMSTLYEYLINNTLPPVCEIWGGERCLKYCDVNQSCDFYHQLVNSLSFPAPTQPTEIEENSSIYDILINYFYASRCRLDAEKEEKELREKIIQWMIENNKSRLSVIIDGQKYIFQIFKRVRINYEIPEEVRHTYPSKIVPFFVINIKKEEK